MAGVWESRAKPFFFQPHAFSFVPSLQTESLEMATSLFNNISECSINVILWDKWCFV